MITLPFSYLSAQTLEGRDENFQSLVVGMEEFLALAV